mmetsp:Transcript_14592/g.27064  ORF Transcript_14592/g.27064 Transcript_14592/m.27064 type:complete len:347 (-) Transcript_14592:1881-2921(-)
MDPGELVQNAENTTQDHLFREVLYRFSTEFRTFSSGHLNRLFSIYHQMQNLIKSRAFGGRIQVFDISTRSLEPLPRINVKGDKVCGWSHRNIDTANAISKFFRFKPHCSIMISMSERQAYGTVDLDSNSRSHRKVFNDLTHINLFQERKVTVCNNYSIRPCPAFRIVGIHRVTPGAFVPPSGSSQVSSVRRPSQGHPFWFFPLARRTPPIRVINVLFLFPCLCGLSRCLRDRTCAFFRTNPIARHRHIAVCVSVFSWLCFRSLRYLWAGHEHHSFFWRSNLMLPTLLDCGSEAFYFFTKMLTELRDRLACSCFHQNISGDKFDLIHTVKSLFKLLQRRSGCLGLFR